ncbi:hypothetical protein GALMADRAFT_249433 [Galerina marginata CBS 339.88]|uniref:Uncharacterized protein n=1 Tax=Galerina marginata (strain CBS 339.88) TaxID=685588 RepID=A0A067SZ94_GALM3|nr:hypothetical protein GALMADRAFT_249433 [Galerina marginata CBS 339.88]
MSNKPKSSSKPLPLSDVLRDLAILRSFGLDLPDVFKSTTETNRDSSDSSVQQSVSTSYEFVQAARAALRLRDSGKLDSQGNAIEQVRHKYEEVWNGLQAK